jgi:hypothetical protein
MNAFKPAFRPAIRPAITSVFGVKVPPLTFTLQPQSKTVDEYSLATFSCEVTGGVAPYSYQWKKNGANVGTDSAALSFTAAATDKNASITVVVADSVGTVVTSTAAGLGVIVSRNFTTVDPILQSYYVMQTPATIDGTKPTSWLFATKSTATMLVLGAGVSPERFYVGFEGGKLLIGNGVNRVVDTLLVNDGKLHSLTWLTSGGVFRVDIDGVTRYSAAMSATLPKSFSNYGRENAGAFYFDGVLANLAVGSESWKLDRPIGTNTEQSSSGNNLLTYVNATNRELFTKVGNDFFGVNNSWGSNNYTAANTAVVTTVQAGFSWDISSTNGSLTNAAHGGRRSDLALIVGGVYEYSVSSSELINTPIYNGSFVLVASGTSAASLRFVAQAVSKLYVAPLTLNVARVSNPKVIRILEVA